MEDRTTIGVTDAAAYWDKPRKVSRPVVAHDLDIRSDMHTQDKPRPSEDSGYLPLRSRDRGPEGNRKGLSQSSER